MNAIVGAGYAAAPALAARYSAQRAIALWLQVCAGVVAGVLIVGGVTRLTHSGLSIVQWHPLSGILPPLSQQDWAALFEQYRASPEYRLVNSTMTLDGFKPIFWWEYAHRVLGRVAGLVFLLPFLGFLAAGRIARPLAGRLALIFVLGALQGALGWYMVASGLVDDPRVSPLRLGAHLGMALLLIGLLLWTSWSVGSGHGRRGPVTVPARAAIAAVFLMALSGALMAGTRAGLAYDTFPLMGGYVIPPDLLRLEPWSRNFLENLALVHFLHRAMALIVLVAVVNFWWQERRAPWGRQFTTARNGMVAALALQIALGIATVLSAVAVPVAAAHQASAVLLYACVLRSAFQSGTQR